MDELNQKLDHIRNTKLSQATQNFDKLTNEVLCLVARELNFINKFTEPRFAA